MALDILPQSLVSIISKSSLVLSVLALIIGFAKAIYNACFHPLSKFPGPLSAAVSNFWYCYWFLSGKQPTHVLQLHKKYGPIVRTAPNELSFNTAQSWKDIYEFRPGHLTFVKSEFYDGGSFADRCGSIVSERDPGVHGIMRKYLSHAFSQRSLIEQEYLISKSVNAFIHRVGKEGAQGIDIVMAFTLMSFDIIGDLGFGETFKGLESEHVHPWIARMTNAMMQGAIADCFKRFPTMAGVILTFFGGHIKRIIADTKTPYAAAKLKEEVRGTFTSYSDINAASTASLGYMHAVILEGLRIYPPLPFALPRIAPKGGDTVDGNFLPAGTVVSTNPVAASLDPANFEDPHTFKPERWLGPNERDDLNASKPFSLGPRGCIGQNLGWMEMRTTLAKLFFKYDLQLLDTKIDWLQDSKMHTLWKKPGLRVKVSARS